MGWVVLLVVVVIVSGRRGMIGPMEGYQGSYCRRHANRVPPLQYIRRSAEPILKLSEKKWERQKGKESKNKKRDRKRRKWKIKINK